jgi:hypothetical protein
MFDALTRHDPHVGRHLTKKGLNQRSLANPQLTCDKNRLATPLERSAKVLVQPTKLVVSPYKPRSLPTRCGRFLSLDGMFPAGLPGIDFMSECVDRSDRGMTMPVYW